MALDSSGSERQCADDVAVDMGVDAYLDRIGIDPDTVGHPTLQTLERLQLAHVRTVPFENLSIVGDPYGDREGDGVVLSLPAIYEKIVDRERGGFCFELNGLFAWLLDALGFDIRRVAARVFTSEGPTTPANHHAIVVELDRPYVTDVGLARPISCPLPIAGTARDHGETVWRVVESTRPDADYRVDARPLDTDEWTNYYVFRNVSRSLRYFEATCDYLQTAPESPFTGEPLVSIVDGDGYRKLSGKILERITGSEIQSEQISEATFYDVLETTFRLRIDE